MNTFWVVWIMIVFDGIPFDDHSLDHVSMNVYWSGCASESELIYSLTTCATSLHCFWSLLLPFLGDMKHSPIFAAGYFWWILSIAMPCLTITAGADDLIYITSFVPKCITTWSGFSSWSLFSSAAFTSCSAISSGAPDWFEMMTLSGDCDLVGMLRWSTNYWRYRCCYYWC